MMGWFEQKQNPVDIQVNDEWVWVTGFKGTESDMTCRDFQYEMNKVFEMPAEQEIKECESGFHLCLGLAEVFKYYRLGVGHRFFEVKALVKKADVSYYRDKLVAKAIAFIRELDKDEILNEAFRTLRPYERASLKFDKWTDKHKDEAIKIGLAQAQRSYQCDELTRFGYSKEFALHVIFLGAYDVAHAVGTQEDLSMDMKAMYIYQATAIAAMNQQSRKPATRSRYSSLDF